VFLVASDKAGRWSNWYSSAIKQAEESYAIYPKSRTSGARSAETAGDHRKAGASHG
jgi:hypothetical protein